MRRENAFTDMSAEVKGYRDQPPKFMARFKSTDTYPEMKLRRALRESSLSGYRVNCRQITGCPDLAYTRWRVAVFVDGAFWHGHPTKFTFGTKGEYWDGKIRRNQLRDEFVNDALREQGWDVLRFWDFDVKKEIDEVVEVVAQTLQRRGRPMMSPSPE